MKVPFKEEIISLAIAGTSAAALIGVIATIQKAPTPTTEVVVAPFGPLAVDAVDAATGVPAAFYETAMTGEPVWEFEGVSAYHHIPPAVANPDATPVMEFYGLEPSRD